MTYDIIKNTSRHQYMCNIIILEATKHFSEELKNT